MKQVNQEMLNNTAETYYARLYQADPEKPNWTSLSDGERAAFIDRTRKEVTDLNGRAQILDPTDPEGKRLIRYENPVLAQVCFYTIDPNFSSFAPRAVYFPTEAPAPEAPRVIDTHPIAGRASRRPIEPSEE